MGQAKRKQSATQVFIAKYPDCFFCGGRRRSTTREHMPPKSLFDSSHRPDKLVMPACSECNRETSTADLTAAIISRWDYFSSEQSNRDHRRLTAQVRVQAPELIEEWAKLADADEEEKERARQHLRNYGVPVPSDAGVATIGPITISQLNLFAHKVALALHFEHRNIRCPLQVGFARIGRRRKILSRAGFPRSYSAYCQTTVRSFKDAGMKARLSNTDMRSTLKKGYSGVWQG